MVSVRFRIFYGQIYFRKRGRNYDFYQPGGSIYDAWLFSFSSQVVIGSIPESKIPNDYQVYWMVFHNNCGIKKFQPLQTIVGHEIRLHDFYVLPTCRKNGTILSPLFDRNCETICRSDSRLAMSNCKTQVCIFTYFMIMNTVNKMLIEKNGIENHLMVHMEFQGKGNMLPDTKILSFVQPNYGAIVLPAVVTHTFYCIRLIHFFPPDFNILLEPFQPPV